MRHRASGHAESLLEVLSCDFGHGVDHLSHVDILLACVLSLELFVGHNRVANGGSLRAGAEFGQISAREAFSLLGQEVEVNIGSYWRLLEGGLDDSLS